MATLNLESIANLANENYSCPSGWVTDVYLDPINGRVYNFLNYNSMPVESYNNIDRRVCRIRPNAIPQSVRDHIENLTVRLQDLLDQFIGTEWDGNNHKGLWQTIPDEADFWSDFSEENSSVAYYSEPFDWFTKQDLDKSWVASKTPEQVHNESIFETDGSACKESDALEYLQSQYKEWLMDNENAD